MARAGSERIVTVMAVLFGLGMTTVGVGVDRGVPVVVIGLAMMGFAAGAWDVAMNVHGAAVERHLGRSVMSRFHAGFSLGTVAGALVGAVMVALDVSVTAHLIVMAVLVSTSVVIAARHFLVDEPEPALAAVPTGGADHPISADEPAPRRGHFAAWRERRTLLIGVFVLAFAFAEGVGNDWIAVAMIDGYGADEAVGTFVFAAFLSAMTLGRWFGPAALDRYGRTNVVRLLAVLGIAGTAVFVYAPFAWLAVGGAVLWGLGASLGFPVGMSAGADEPAFAAGRVSVISSIGYCAFLVGPPLIGFLGDQVGVLSALVVVAALLGLSALIAPVLAPPSVDEPEVALIT